MIEEETEMVGVREYAEEMPVKLRLHESGRVVVDARNEGGHNGTDVDLEDLLEWVYRNRPDLWERRL